MTAIHFMGIQGSGASAVAQLAVARGYTVTGCDTGSGQYLPADWAHPVAHEHDVGHLTDQVKRVIISPALLHVKPVPEELAVAQERDLVQTWQAFLGQELLAEQPLTCVAGSHGKSTTTALLGLLVEAAGLDPTVVLGAKVPQWQTNVRVGTPAVNVVEADEYNRNFHHYRPTVIGLNNVDYEHPEYYRSAEEYDASFAHFLAQISVDGVLIYNATDAGAVRIVHHLVRNNVKLVPIGREGDAWQVRSRKVTALGQRLILQTPQGELVLEQPLIGAHNAANTLLALALADAMGVDVHSAASAKVVRGFAGVGRRLQTVLQTEGLTLYDDYGHHPTEIAVTLQALREQYPDEQLVAVVEPHQISRLNEFFEAWVECLRAADVVCMTKIFTGREAHLTPPDLTPLKTQLAPAQVFIDDDFATTVQHVQQSLQQPSRVVVFGAGQSQQLTQQLERILS